METSFETDDTAFQIELGSRYDFNDRWFLDGGVTYLEASDVKMEFESDDAITVSSDYSHWTASLGVGLRF